MANPRGGVRRVSVDVLEADADIGFSLVDMAEAERRIEDFVAASRALQEAENVYSDIKVEMTRLSGDQCAGLVGLLGELRRAIDAAQQRAVPKAES
jgi:hypothetical protein